MKTGQLRNSIPDGLKEVDKDGKKILTIPMPNLDNIEEAEYEEVNNFIPCSNCDGHDACWDFGCAIKQEIIEPNWK